MRQQRQTKTVGDGAGILCSIALGLVFGPAVVPYANAADAASYAYADRHAAKKAPAPAPQTKTIAEQERDFFKPAGFGFSRAFAL